MATDSTTAQTPLSDADLRHRPWEAWRDLMPVCQDLAYFDHAAVAPISKPAAGAITAYAEQSTQLGDTVWPSWNHTYQSLRTIGADLLGCEPTDVCIIPNTTTGINLVAEGWPWKPGDSVIVPDGEFPSNLFPWLNQQQKGVDVRIVPRRSGDVVSVDDLLDHADDSTKLIACSWVGYASGFRIDVDDLVRRAHQRGVAVFLDAIQGLGMYPLDLQSTPVDFLAADGHKWMLGPEGIGIAMISEKHRSTLRCGNVGWASVKNSHNYTKPKLDLREDAGRFESGSPNMVGAAGLAASMQIFSQVHSALGPTAIEQRVLCLTDQLCWKLDQLGAMVARHSDPRHCSGIVNFQLPSIQPSKIRNACLDNQVVVSCRGDGVRASVHAFNNDDDIDRLIQTLKTMTAAGTGGRQA